MPRSWLYLLCRLITPIDVHNPLGSGLTSMPNKKEHSCEAVTKVTIGRHHSRWKRYHHTTRRNSPFSERIQAHIYLEREDYAWASIWCSDNQVTLSRTVSKSPPTIPK